MIDMHIAPVYSANVHYARMYFFYPSLIIHRLYVHDHQCICNTLEHLSGITHTCTLRTKCRIVVINNMTRSNPDFGLIYLLVHDYRK